MDHYHPGEIVIKEGAYGIKFYVIARGIAKIFNNNVDNPLEIYIKPGEFFGEIALLGGNLSLLKRTASYFSMFIKNSFPFKE